MNATWTQRSAEVGGCDVTYLSRRNPGAPTLVLLHCGGGNASWLLPMADRLRDDFALVVPDLSGHGDSGRRARYEPETWAAEVAALIEQEAPGGAWLAGHSMGGLVGLAAGSHHAVLGLVLVDAPIEHVVRRDYPADGRVYPTEQEALAAFRLRPADTIAEPALLADVARSSVRPVEGGWSWKADGRARQRFSPESVAASLRTVRCPLAFVHGSRSPYADAGTVERVRQVTGRPTPSAVVDGAFHHVPLDDPEACATAVGKVQATLAS